MLGVLMELTGVGRTEPPTGPLLFLEVFPKLTVIYFDVKNEREGKNCDIFISVYLEV